MAQLATRANILIHEALYSDIVQPDLLTWNAGANTVGALADEAQVRRLVLTHLLPPPTTSHAEQAFEDQARTGGYTGPIDVAADLLRLSFN